MKYYLGAAKLVVTGGQNVPFLFPAHLNHTIPLRMSETNFLIAYIIL